MIEERPQRYLTATADQPVIQPGAPDYSWQDQQILDGLAANERNTSYNAASIQRDHLRQYYNSVAAVEWQDRMIIQARPGNFFILLFLFLCDILQLAT